MNTRDQRRAKIRKTIKGNADRPRLVVFRSNRFFYAQIIDDVAGKTLASVNRMTDEVEAGKELASKALSAKIKAVVFDRAGYRYHGRVKKFAEAVIEAGLKI